MVKYLFSSCTDCMIPVQANPFSFQIISYKYPIPHINHMKISAAGLPNKIELLSLTPLHARNQLAETTENIQSLVHRHCIMPLEFSICQSLGSEVRICFYSWACSVQGPKQGRFHSTPLHGASK